MASILTWKLTFQRTVGSGIRDLPAMMLELISAAAGSATDHFGKGTARKSG
jgi:hypothetical protein